MPFRCEVVNIKEMMPKDLKLEDIPFISHQRRELYFRIVNGVVNHGPITFALCYLQEHFPPLKLDTALMWLVESNIVGSKFVQWYHQECSSSDLEMQRQLLMVIGNEKAPVRIIAGKNFKV